MKARFKKGSDVVVCMSGTWSVENLFFFNVSRFSPKCPMFLVQISENLQVLVKIMLINKLIKLFNKI
jgi:hypothetical protein